MGAGQTRTLMLPMRLVAYAGGLRFHVFPGKALESHFAAVLPIDTALLLQLEVPEQPVPSCKLSMLVDGQPFDGGLQSIPREDVLKIELVVARTSGIEEGDACPRIEVVTRSAAARAR